MKSLKNSSMLVVLALLVVSAVVYLPLAGKIGISNDDWYLTYDAHVAGPQFFHIVYGGDRPARAFVLGSAYALFGDHVIDFHLTGYAFRLIGALALFWALGLVWPRQRVANLGVALLFLIYPGFLSQTNPIDYQSQLLSLCLSMISIALTVKSIQSIQPVVKVSLAAISILLGWAYLGLVEYHMGLEVLRLLLIVILVMRQELAGLKNRLVKISRLWLPYILIPVGFIVWRTFLFHVQRRATDINYQIGEWVAAPVYKSFIWLLALIQDTLKVIFLAWTIPFYNLVSQLRLRDMVIGLVISIVVALIMLFVYSQISESVEVSEIKTDWRKEMFFVGLFSAVGGLLPIIIANRSADFGSYSRYTLASSAGSVMVVVALFGFLSSVRVRMAALALLTAMASYTHYANAVNAAHDTQNINNFWWQVSWRVPQIKDGTTLVASYPGNTGIPEDYFIWGPANLIYALEKQTANLINIRVPAAILDQGTTLQIMSGRGSFSNIRRGNASIQDYGNILVLAQAASDGCVRVIDGNQPELSTVDTQNIMLIASKSRINNVVLDANHQNPSAVIFSSEPDHGWCYYYEKASLAAQQGDWKKVMSLGDKALADGLYPSDRVEWMPFLRAYVMTDNLNKIKPIVSIISADTFLKKETCQILSSAAQSASADMQTFVKESFCK